MPYNPQSHASLPPRHGFFASEARRVLLLVILCDLLVLVVYVWLISVGTWTLWPTHWFAYDALATSFRHGELALETKPAPALLALADPYDPAARQAIDFPQDASLYKGRFYLYFGPVPGLVLVLAKTIIAGRIGDQYLTFAFAAGIFLVQSLLLVAIRRRSFPEASPWTLAPAILAAGLTVPLVWIVSTPSVYNAAITAGQCFFLAGFLAAFSAFSHDRPSNSRLALAGLLWAAALGSRITQILPVAFMVGLSLAGLALQARRAGSFRRSGASAFALLVPLAIGMLGLAWYNWARFGSVFETGIKYQLAGVPLQQYGSRIYSPLYVVQNIYNYFLNLPTFKYPFPYLFPAQGVAKSVIPSIPLPPIYRAQEVTGLLYTLPFLLLAVLPLVGILRRQPVSSPEDSHAPLLTWLIFALAGSFLFAGSFFILFFWAAERYLADFLPSLLLLSMVGMWQLDRYLSSRPRLRAAFWALLVSLMLASIVISILLSMTFNSDGFRQLNPVLWRQLSNLFRP